MYKMDHDIPWNLKLEYITYRVKRHKKLVVTHVFLYILKEECFHSKFVSQILEILFPTV